MSITLDSFTFDDAHTSAREDYEEVGGRNVRSILLTGAIVGESTVGDIEDKIDELLDTASTEDYAAVLSLRPGRRLFVRRNKFTREVAADSLVGSYKLELEAKDPFEESVAQSSLNWNVTASGQTQVVSVVGNVYARPIITLVASGAVINPTLSDGTQSIAYSGTVNDGETLVFNATTQTLALDGVDVTPYAAGVFNRLEPAGTTLTYTDDAASSHTATITIAHRDRWW